MCHTSIMYSSVCIRTMPRFLSASIRVTACLRCCRLLRVWCCVLERLGRLFSVSRGG